MPNGSYQLVVFDSALDLIIGSAVVNVTGAAKDVGDVAVFTWFTNLYSYVFEDTRTATASQRRRNRACGRSPDQALNIRFRDGSIYQSLSTDDRGFKAFNEVFPFFAWMVAEVDYARYHSTGVTVVVDNGGDANAPCADAGLARTAAGFPTTFPDVPCNTLSPQPQPDNGGLPFRTESGAETPFLLLEGFQGFIGQSTVMMWGKAPYRQPGSIDPRTSTSRRSTTDPSRVQGDVDGNGDGIFNTDHFNGGIAGIVHYGITRAENDPRWAAAENWEPGVSDVRVQLWDENRTHLLNEVTTDNWNNSLPDRLPVAEACRTSTRGSRRTASTVCATSTRRARRCSTAATRSARSSSDGAHPARSTDAGAFERPDRRGQPSGQPSAATRRSRFPPAGTWSRSSCRPATSSRRKRTRTSTSATRYVPRQFWLSGYTAGRRGRRPGRRPAGADRRGQRAHRALLRRPAARGARRPVALPRPAGGRLRR